MYSIVCKFKKPEESEYCEGCKYCRTIDTSFDHEFGTHHQEGLECQCDEGNMKYYGECLIITNEIDEAFESETIQKITIEID